MLHLLSIFIMANDALPALPSASLSPEFNTGVALQEDAKHLLDQSMHQTLEALRHQAEDTLHQVLQQAETRAEQTVADAIAKEREGEAKIMNTPITLNQIRNAIVEHDQLTAQNGALQTQASQLSTQLTNVEAQRAALENEKTTLTNELATLTQTRDALVASIADKDLTIAAKDGVNAALVQERNTLNAQLQTVTAQIEERNQTIAAKDSANAALAQERDALNAQLQALTAQLVQLTTEKNALSLQLSQQQAAPQLTAQYNATKRAYFVYAVLSMQLLAKYASGVSDADKRAFLSTQTVLHQYPEFWDTNVGGIMVPGLGVSPHLTLPSDTRTSIGVDQNEYFTKLNGSVQGNGVAL